MTPEGRVKEDVCTWLKLGRVEFWTTVSSAIYDPKRRSFRRPPKWFRAGQPDLWGFLPIPEYPPFWFELKSKTGTLSPAQREFRDALQSRGHRWALVRGVPDAEAAFRRWGVTLSVERVVPKTVK